MHYKIREKQKTFYLKKRIFFSQLIQLMIFLKLSIMNRSYDIYWIECKDILEDIKSFDRDEKSIFKSSDLIYDSIEFKLFLSIDSFKSRISWTMISFIIWEF